MQNLKAGGVDTVVIGDENAHGAPGLGTGVVQGRRGGRGMGHEGAAVQSGCD